MSVLKEIKHPKAVLKLPRRIAALIAFVKAIVQAMTGNPWFPAPSPTLATVTTDINNLDAAESVALTKVKGAAGTRNSKKNVVINDSHGLLAYVQGIADVNPLSADAIITGAGMFIKKTGSHVKSLLQVKQGRVSGSVILTAKSSAARASYEWEYSLDAVTWVSLPSTLQAKTTVSGLTPLKTYYFRFKAVLKKGEGNWSTYVSAVVL